MKHRLLLIGALLALSPALGAQTASSIPLDTSAALGKAASAITPDVLEVRGGGRGGGGGGRGGGGGMRGGGGGGGDRTGGRTVLVLGEFLPRQWLRGLLRIGDPSAAFCGPNRQRFGPFAFPLIFDSTEGKR